MIKQPELVITTAPFLKEGKTTPVIMLEVIIATIPAVIASVYFFGIIALLIISTAVIGAVVTEWFFSANRKEAGSILDGSAILTGILLGLVLPPTIPLWMAFLGGVLGISMGKLVWGGLGFNVFNPALLGRAFLQASFPEAMTTWVAPQADILKIDGHNLALPLMKAPLDAATSATPLGLAKFDSVITDLKPMLMGNVGGCLGETSAMLILLGGAFLLIRRTFNWRLPVSTLLTVFLMSTFLHWLDPGKCPDGTFMLLSGGILFGSIFMVTDPVTTPITSRGMWIFGFGVGFLVVLIRAYGGLPEGVMFAILLMNSVTPLINRITQPRQFGG